MRGNYISGPAAVLVILFFFLPWVTVSCNGQPLGEFSGYDLAAGVPVSTLVGSEALSPLGGLPGDPALFLVPLVALITLLWVILAFVKREWEVYTGAGMVAAAVLGVLVLVWRWLVIPAQPGELVAISYEPAGEWAKAEADFREALILQPGQPMVQNYLGYSLVEQRGNLDEALGLIEAAVSGEPDNGYITDSLGWVLYRLGRYDEAVPHMLRAVELEPVDPVINDHLGDVLWKVGRKREAEFQWRRALSFGPAPDLDMDRLRAKLSGGLEAVGPEARTPPPAATDGPQDG